MPGSPLSRGFDLAGLGWGPIICIINKFSGNADAAGLGKLTSKITSVMVKNVDLWI